jgi:hypothetical protein
MYGTPDYPTTGSFPYFYARTKMVDTGIVVVLYDPVRAASPFSAEILHQEAVGMSGRNRPDDRFGSSLATGDFNGDGKDELAVGIPHKDIVYPYNQYPTVPNGGMVMVFYTFYGKFKYGSADFIFERRHAFNNWDPYDYAQGGDKFGSSLAAGDVNSDGYDDLAIGIPLKDILAPPFKEYVDGGRIRICYGTKTILNVNLCDKIQANYIGGTPGEGYRFGKTIVLGDFEGDAQDELAVAAPYQDLHSGNENGQVYIEYLGLPW